MTTQLPTKVGVLGGSFDPPHIGHLILSEIARTSLGLDQILLIPANIPPHKQTKLLSSSDDRLHMTQLAAQSMEHFAVSLFELERSGPSYTVETLEALTMQYPTTEFALIVGADNLRTFTSWHRWEEILSLASLAGVRRNGFEEEGIDVVVRNATTMIDVPLVEISSTEIRSRVKLGLSIRHWVPEAVQAYIEEHRLYLL